MTDSERQQLKQFEARVRQLLLQYKTLQAENQQLTQKVAAQQAQVDSLNQQISQLQLDYKTLKTARMIEVSDGDMKNAKQTISLLVREVNKCIGLLSAEQYLGEDKTEQTGTLEDTMLPQQEMMTSSQPDNIPSRPVEEPMFIIDSETLVAPRTKEPSATQPKPRQETEEWTLPFD